MWDFLKSHLNTTRSLETPAASKLKTSQTQTNPPALGRGPPGCEEFGAPASCVLCISFILHPGFFVSSNFCMLGVVLCLLYSAASILDGGVWPGNHPVTTPWAWCLSLGLPEGSHENLLNFEPVSRASKVIKIDPKATQKPQKSTLKLQNFNRRGKLIIATPLTPNAYSWSPRRPDSEPIFF